MNDTKMENAEGTGNRKRDFGRRLPVLLSAAALLIAVVGLGISIRTANRASRETPPVVTPTPEVTAAPVVAPPPADTPVATTAPNPYTEFVAAMQAVEIPYKYEDVFNLAYYADKIPPLPTAGTHSHTELYRQGPLSGELLFDTIKENNRLYLLSHPEDTSVGELADETLLAYCDAIGNFAYQELSFNEGLDVDEMLCKIACFKLLRAEENIGYFVRADDDFCMVVSEEAIKECAEWNAASGFGENGIASHDELLQSELLKATAYLMQKPCLDRRTPDVIRQGVGATVLGEQQNPYAWNWLSDASARKRTYGYTADATHDRTFETEWLDILALSMMCNTSIPINAPETVNYGNDRAQFYELLPMLRPDEIDRMMYSIEICVREPKGFRAARDAIWGEEAMSEAQQNSDDSRSDTEVSLQASALGTLTRNFYLELAGSLREMGQEQLRAAYPDVFYLIKAWEASLNAQIGFTTCGARASVYDFAEWYTRMQDVFFRWLAAQSGASFEEVVQQFGAYEITEGAAALSQLGEVRRAAVNSMYARDGWSMQRTYEDGTFVRLADARDCYANERAEREGA